MNFFYIFLSLGLLLNLSSCCKDTPWIISEMQATVYNEMDQAPVGGNVTTDSLNLEMRIKGKIKSRSKLCKFVKCKFYN